MQNQTNLRIPSQQKPRIVFHHHSVTSIPSYFDQSKSQQSTSLNPVYSLSKLNQIKSETSSPTKVHSMTLKVIPNFKFTKENIKEPLNFSLDQPKEIQALESKLVNIDKLKQVSEKYKLVLEVWPDLEKLANPMNNILVYIKKTFEEIITNYESLIFDLSKLNSELMETKHTLKILQKRFKKIALENLEINGKLNNKENFIIEIKEKHKKSIKKKEFLLVAKENTIKSQNEEISNLHLKIAKIRAKSENYEKKAKNMAKVLNEIKSSEKPGEEVIRQMTNQSYSLENIETEPFNNCSLELDVGSPIISNKKTSHFLIFS